MSMMLHSSSRDDECNLTAEQCAYRSGHWRYWLDFIFIRWPLIPSSLPSSAAGSITTHRYRADLVYAIGTASFIIAVIGLCSLVSGSSAWCRPDLAEIEDGTRSGRRCASRRTSASMWGPAKLKYRYHWVS